MESPDFTKSQSTIFEDFQAKYRNLQIEMSTVLDDLKESKNLLDQKITEAETTNALAKKLEKDAQSKMSQANLLMEKAEAIEKQAKDNLESSRRLKESNEVTEKAIILQRDEVIAREQAVLQAEKMIEMKQRKIKFERMKVDKIIEDAHIQKEMETFKDE